MDSFIVFLKEIITLKDEQMEIKPEMELVGDIGITSLDMMVIVLEIERKYNKNLPFEKLLNVKTVIDLYMLTQ